MQNLTIRKRLTLMFMLVSSIAVVMAVICFTVFSVVIARRAIVEDLRGLAGVAGENCEAALVFDIAQDAENVLGTLRAKPSVRSAQLLDPEGRVLARFRRDTNGRMPPNEAAPRSGYRFGRDFLRVVEPVVRQGDTIGWVVIDDDMSQVRDAIESNSLAAVGVILVVLALAYLLSARLGRVVSNPILRLAETAGTVSTKKDYSVRVRLTRSDEIGLLSRTLNEMLAGIQERDTKLRGVNATLTEEIRERRRAEEELRRHRDQLDQMVRDRTRELESANERLKETLADLERSNRELERFAEVASHDLQEPLRKISAFGNRLVSRSRSELSEASRGDLDRMVASANRMHLLINDLLTFARIGRRVQNFSQVSLDRIMVDVVRDLGAQIASAGVEVDVDALPVIRADRSEMHQMLRHLVGNAVKYRRPGVTPRVHVYSRAIPEESGTGKRDGLTKGPLLEIVVEDNGVGFDEKYKDRIFKVFQRLHGMGEYSGTGVGLAICERVASRHGGTLDAHSEPGKGSIFVVRLPLDAQAALQTKGEPA